jgi:hypothetical protein
MNVLGNMITAAVALLGVFLGGLVSFRNQDRLWWRDHARQWRDVRLAAYQELLSAHRQYIAFTLEPTAKISAVPHPHLPGHLMPFFDEAGRPYKENLETAMMAVRLISEDQQTVDACTELVRRARQVAAARATHNASDYLTEPFQELWAAEKVFMAAARQELGLTPTPRSPAQG